MWCPKCEKLNKCPCKSCNHGESTDLLILLKKEELYQCCFCGYKFDESESVDFEWDRIIEDFSKIATPELCLKWISILGKERELFEKEIGFGEFGFEKSIEIHFGISYKSITTDVYDGLKRQLDRDRKLKKLFN